MNWGSAYCCECSGWPKHLSVGDLIGNVESKSTNPVFTRILFIASTSASARWARQVSQVYEQSNTSLLVLHYNKLYLGMFHSQRSDERGSQDWICPVVCPSFLDWKYSTCTCLWITIRKVNPTCFRCPSVSEKWILWDDNWERASFSGHRLISANSIGKSKQYPFWATRIVCGYIHFTNWSSVHQCFGQTRIVITVRCFIELLCCDVDPLQNLR